jgi:phosphatidyl-myo-inositol dimannoside synthase
MKNAKSIIFFTTDSKPMRGGIAEYLHQFSEHLGLLHFSVQMHSTVPSCFDWHPKNYQINPLAKRPLRQLGEKWGDRFFATRKLNTLAYYQALKKIALSEIRCFSSEKNCLVIIGAWSPESHFWCDACRYFEIPYGVVYHGLDLICRLNETASRWRKEDLLEAAFVIVNSRATGGLASRIAGRQIRYELLNPGVSRNGGFFTPNQGQIWEKRLKLGIPGGSRIGLSVGRLIKRKGFDLVIESLAFLRNEFPNLYYVIVGDGPERETLKKMADSSGVGDRTVILTEVKDEEKWVLYAMSDFFVMPNRTLEGTDWEGFGIVFLEAALLGKPSIGGNNGGVSDAIVHHETGFLVETDDYRQTAQSIKYLMDNESIQIQMGKAAQRRAVDHFDWNVLVRSFSERVPCN